MSCSAAPRESKTGWEHFPHDADVDVRGRGLRAAEAFEQRRPHHAWGGQPADRG